jgi:signal transduction histidine kinase
MGHSPRSAASRPQVRHKAGVAMDSGRFRVLLIEDNSSQVQLIHAILRKLGGASYDLVSASSLAAGLEHLTRGWFDVILLDLMLPDSRGMETFLAVQARAQDVPIVVLSGIDDEALAVHVVREGAQDYLIKGQVSNESLVHSIRHAIERHRIQAEVALRQYADRLQALSRRLVEVQEAERRTIAGELHDEIGQALTGLKFVLEMVGRQPPGDASAKLREAHSLVNQLLHKVRTLSLDLRPSALDDLGLLPALLMMCDRYTAQTNVRVTVKHTGVEGQRFAPDTETGAYRIVQEALTNVARYAAVKEATVRLWVEDAVLGVQVEDAGAGFDPESTLATPRSSGLAGMRERATLLGGHLIVDSAPGRGTRVTAELPLRGSAPEKPERTG